MERSENNNSFELEKKLGDGLSIQSSGISADWQFYSQAMNMVPATGFMNPLTLSPYPSAPLLEGHPNDSNHIPVGKTMTMSPRGMLMPTVPGIFPSVLSHFPSDFAFLDRAVSLSCFSGGNSCGMNLFGPSEDALKVAMGIQLEETRLNTTDKKVASLPADLSSNNGNSTKTARDQGSSHICISNSSSNEGKTSSADAGGISSSSDTVANKKRRTIKDMEDQAQRETQISLETTKERTETTQKVKQSSSKHVGRNGNDSSKTPKEDHVHIRARRGQAISSHSLAERLRREKISERMKYLQELVPGCSKVTGKAVMLDEIINYVQSLQRQVEFLSMKLAAVNPLDFIPEELLAKNVIHSQAGLPSTGFSQEINYPQIYPSSPQNMVHVGMSVMANPSDEYRRAMNTQLSNNSG
ncbi:hypothetical protein Cni_G27983 [Canna indica]|uniref:BHLH domain-containing protein n=1 Tax=Canna indica TaxID=4628 RepID=A0AAQ3QRY7_9LILI|nr:hypothetical protein Cni_G27983 [Canna indica]